LKSVIFFFKFWMFVEVTIILRPAVSRPVYLGVRHPSRAQDQIFLTSRQLRVFWRRAYSLTRGRICRLQLQLVLARAVILWSETHRTHDRILLSQIGDSPNLEGHVPVFISPRNRVARLYPHSLGSLFIVSYDSQGYGGGIRTRLHGGVGCLIWSYLTWKHVCSLSCFLPRG
jgi:hypothetical protein